jgi:hypothetical protein
MYYTVIILVVVVVVVRSCEHDNELLGYINSLAFLD